MADMLGIGSLATNTFKRAIEVTSHNVANVGTVGFHRQAANIVSNSANMTGQVFGGGGARVDTVQRIIAPYIQDQLVASNSMMTRYDQQLQLSKQVEGIVGSNDQGVQQFMQRFFDSLQNLSNAPVSETNRQLVLDEAGNMEGHIQNINLILQDTQYQVNNEISNSIVEINNRLQTIQAINTQVSSSFIKGAQVPNDLLDQRDQAIFELSTYMDIKTYTQPNGRIDIHMGDGRFPLISDNTLTTLESNLSQYQSENRTEVYMNISGQRTNMSDYIKGGQLGGVLDFRKNMLDNALNDMGAMLNGMVSAINWQHYQGYDINGNAGGNFFQPLASTVVNNLGNDPASSDGAAISVSFNPPLPAGVTDLPPFDGTAGHAQPTVYQDKLNYLNNAQTAIGNLQPREYIMRFDSALDAGAGGFYVFDRQTNVQLGSFALDPANPSQIDGLEFKGDGGTYVNGDQFLVSPNKDIVKNFAKVISDPQQLATRGQSPFDAVTGLNLDPATSAPAPAGVGDNVNAANLASLQAKKLMFADTAGNPAETLLGSYSKMATNVGMYVRGTDIQLTAQTNVYQNIKNQSESISGVNLDEEAANLMRFQQAYEAAAKIIQTSQTLFQTLISVIR